MVQRFRKQANRLLRVAAAIVAITAGAHAPAFARNSKASSATSGRIRLTLRLSGTPKQRTGGLSGAPGGGRPGGPPAPAPVYRGVFSIAGAFRDGGTMSFRLPSLGSANNESTVQLHGKRGSLRLALGGSGSSTGSAGGEARWRVISGSGVYARASGGGTLTPSPRASVLVGVLSLRDR